MMPLSLPYYRYQDADNRIEEQRNYKSSLQAYRGLMVHQDK